MKDGAALELDSIDVFKGEGDEVVVEHSPPAIEKADKFVSVVVDALFDSGIDDRIQSGAIAAAGQQSNSHLENLLVKSHGRPDC